jgi:hypothetical protein
MEIMDANSHLSMSTEPHSNKFSLHENFTIITASRDSLKRNMLYANNPDFLFLDTMKFLNHLQA